MKRIESPYKNESWLREKYLQLRWTAKEMAEFAKVSTGTIRSWMGLFGIPSRSTSEALTGRYAGQNAFFYGRKHSATTKSKISSNHADVSGTNNPMFGKIGYLAPNFHRVKSDETRRKLSNALRGKPRPDLVGVKNPFWKGGRTSLLAKIRASASCIEWRDSVYKRDCYTCQECGDDHGGNLNAHHLEPLAVLLDKLSIKTLNEAITCVDLWDTANGITLCKSCHARKHPKRIVRVSG